MNDNGSSVERIKSQARYTGLILRHTVYFLASVVYLVQPHHTVTGLIVAGTALIWSIYRMSMRRADSAVELIVDYVVVVIIAATLQYTLGGLDYSTTNPYPMAIVGTSVIGFTMALVFYQSLLTTIGLVMAFAYGATRLPEVGSPFGIYWVYYFVVQWSIVYFMRWLVIRSARIADEAARVHLEAEMSGSVARARRTSQREHWATLHDTAAATLMMVGQGVPVERNRLMSRATRDLAAMRALPSWLSEAAEVDLLAGIRSVLEESHIDVELTALSRPTATPSIVGAITGAIRESLGNVERHSGVMSARVVVDEGSVMLSDDGRGFDPAAGTPSDTAGHGRGLTESISGRMERVSGHATIESTPGGGTTVRLMWEKTAPDPPDLMDPVRRAERISTGFSAGLIAVAVIFTSLTAIHAGGAQFFGHPTQLTLLGILIVVTVTGGVGVLAGPLPSWLLVVCGLSVCAVSFVQPLTISTQMGGGEHWTAGAEGWVILLLVLNQSRWRMAMLLSLCWLPNLAAAVVLGQLFTLQMQSMAYTAISNLVVQIIMGIFVLEMRRHASQAAAAAALSATALEGQAIASELERDHQLRYESLTATTIPLLESFADGRAHSATVGAREAAALESSRLRRLFDEYDIDVHPLAIELNTLLTAAEGRGISVSIDVDSTLRSLTDSERVALALVPRTMLASAVSYARIVVTDNVDVQISVIADSPDSTRADLANAPHGLDVRTDRDGETLWAQASLTSTDVAIPVRRWRANVGRSTDTAVNARIEQSLR